MKTHIRALCLDRGLQAAHPSEEVPFLDTRGSTLVTRLAESFFRASEMRTSEVALRRASGTGGPCTTFSLKFLLFFSGSNKILLHFLFHFKVLCFTQTLEPAIYCSRSA